MKNIFACTAVLLLIGFSSFTVSQEGKPDTVQTGIYGICGQDSSSRTIELNLMKGHTFTYYNVSYVDGTANCMGKWKEENGVVILFDHNNPFPIHTKWKIESGGTLKSIKSQGTGMMFFRIWYMGNCK